jgi:hypothetical protein
MRAHHSNEKDVKTRQNRQRWLVALAICVLPACGDETYHLSVRGSNGAPTAKDAAVPATDAASPAVDAASPVTDVASTPDAPSPIDTGSSAPDVGAGAADAGPGDTGTESVTVPSVCAGTPSGATILNVPADCHATICDGAGQAAGAVVVPSNVPTPGGPCLVGLCDALGRPSTSPLAAGTACSRTVGAGMCDGAGSCVECLRTLDCAPGLYCDASHRCGSAPCTDLDCGGACPPCEAGKRCFADADCQSFACDVDSATCIDNQCLDHVQDGNETAVDCGGGICKGCGFGQACLLDEDCGSMACDAVSLKCVAYQCADHRVDGMETDVDCGGGCDQCATGQKCRWNGDCQPGHVCIGNKVCS